MTSHLTEHQAASMTLHEILHHFELDSEPGPHGQRHVFRISDGERLCTGSAYGVMYWLREEGYIVG